MTGPPNPATTSASLEAVFADDAAFRSWYERSLPAVFRYLYHRCGRDRDLAEELTRQVFVEAVRSHHRFVGGDAMPWLIGIARHRLVDHFRVLERRERGVRQLMLERPASGSINESGIDGELAAALAALPAAQRAAIVLRYLDDLSVRDVARTMQRSEGAIESLLSRGRESLRRLYPGVAR